MFLPVSPLSREAVLPAKTIIAFEPVRSVLGKLNADGHGLHLRPAVSPVFTSFASSKL
jgi:hypothetical protein